MKTIWHKESGEEVYVYTKGNNYAFGKFTKGETSFKLIDTGFLMSADIFRDTADLIEAFYHG